MLITRESTSPITHTEIIDWTAISPLTRWVSGIVSVGLNATTLVNATYRWSGKRGCQPGGAEPLGAGLRELEVGVGPRVGHRRAAGPPPSICQ